MRTLLGGCAAALTLAASPAVAADFVVIRQEVAVDRPAAAVWAKVGDYCAIGVWLKLKCVYTSGTGEVGTVRRLVDRIDEVLVAKTAVSHTYADVDPKLLYHGHLAAEPVDARRSRLVYTLVYDQAPLGDPAAQAADRARRTAMFKRALDTMKAMAEAE